MNLRLAIFAVAPLAALACGSDPTPPPAAPTGPTDMGQQAATEQPSDDKDPNQGNVNIDPEIRKACGITEKDAFFAYNSARLDDRARTVMEKLAKCFKDGPLKDRSMHLIGHADPRGDEEYNLLLGGRRADSVRGVLMKYGLGKDRITTTSRGEMDASGVDPSGWAKDRRVDVTLGS